jgi:GNAT superfamily N-acetyltransferase
MASAQVRLRDQTTGSGSLCRRILDALPSWFGVPESVEDYISASDRLPTAVSSVGDDDVGFLTWLVHTPFAAEIYVMGVLPNFHHRGIGRQLLNHVENLLAQDGVEFLQVKTLSPSKPDAGYEKTRAFYFSCGFRPLEELTLWGPDNPALQMVKKVDSANRQGSQPSVLLSNSPQTEAARRDRGKS